MQTSVVILIVGLAILAIGLASSWVLSRTITRPLRALMEATSAIAGGDFSRQVDIRRKDEFGELANSFNAMGARVHASQRDLERKVQERTVELRERNQELDAFAYSSATSWTSRLCHVMACCVSTAHASPPAGAVSARAGRITPWPVSETVGSGPGTLAVHVSVPA